MSRQTFPTFVDQPGCIFRNFRVDGATVGATAGTSGLDGRGKFLCTISKLANVVTVNWNVPFGDVPYVFAQISAGQTNTSVEIVSSTASTLVYQTVQDADGATGVNDADVDFLVCGYTTDSFVS